MKKSLLIIAGAVFLTLGLSSCKKNWTCTCSNGDSFTIADQTKSNANTSCTTYAGLTGTTCNL